MKTFLIFFLANILMFGIISNTAAQKYTDEQIVNAIFHAEGGFNATYLFGIRSVNYKTGGTFHDDFNEAKRICFNTVKNNRRRYKEYGQREFGDFLSFLGARYAPISAGNDRQGLNRHWLKNVRFFLRNPRPIDFL